MAEALCTDAPKGEEIGSESPSTEKNLAEKKEKFNYETFDDECFIKTPEAQFIQTMVITKLEPDDVAIKTIWISYIHSEHVYKLLWDGSILAKSESFSKPVMKLVALTEDSVLACEFDGNTLYKVGSSGEISKYCDVCDKKYRTQDFTVTPNGHIFLLLWPSLSTKGSSKVTEVRPSGEVVRTFESNRFGIRHFKCPLYIAVHNDILLTIYKKIPMFGGYRPNHTRLMYLDLKRNSKTKISKYDPKQFRRYVGAKYASDDVILLVDSRCNSLVMFNTKTKLLKEIADLGSVKGYPGMEYDCFDVSGSQIYLALAGGIIQQIALETRLIKSN